MRNNTQEIIECSEWLFPALLFSRWCWPLVMLINTIMEVFGVW